MQNKNPKNRKCLLTLFLSGLCFALTFFSSSVAAAETPTENFLGKGFEERTGFSPKDPSNQSLQTRPQEFQEGGVGILNAIFYNIKDFFKYVAGGMAILWLLIAIVQIVTANTDENIQKGKKNFTWGLYALFLIFLIDIFVIAGFEGGRYNDPTTNWDSLVRFDQSGKPIENRSFMEGIARYFDEEVRMIFAWLKKQVAILAVLFIVLIGIKMVMARGDEEDLERGKKYMVKMLGTFVTLLMLDHFVFGVIYPVSEATGLNTPECVEFLNQGEVTPNDLREAPEECKTALKLGREGKNLTLGLIRFLESLFGAIAVFMIVFSGLALITSFGNEEQVTRHKKALLWSLFGLAIILLSHNLILRFFFVVDPLTGEAGTNIEQGLLDLAGIANFIITFISVFAMVSIIIAGVFWVVNFGNTEIAEKSKKIILWALIAIVISISAYAVVNSLATGSPQGLGQGELRATGRNYDLGIDLEKTRELFE